MKAARIMNNEFSQCSFLVVDDDEISGDVIFGVLNSLGATEISYAHNYETALTIAKQQRPDFILLDIYMPEVDGWAILDKLRGILPSAAILMITSSVDPLDFKKSMDERVDGYCIKPVMPDIMRKSLQSARKRRQTFLTPSH
jgi:CheY-like chemotaxis protein